MGIRPNRGGLIPRPVQDTTESRYEDWLMGVEDNLAPGADVIGEVDAKATSGNSGVTDLANRVAALETRVATAENLLRFAVIAVPPASLDDLPGGQVYLDQDTGTISQKP